MENDDDIRYVGAEEGVIDTGYVLIPEYNNYLINKALSSTRSYDWFHPSSFGGCLRKIVLQHFGEKSSNLKEPRIPDPRAERIFDNGHFLHHRMQRAFSEMGILRGYWKSKLSGNVYGKESQIGIFRPQSLRVIGEENLLQPGDTRGIEDLLEYEEIRLESEEYNFKGNCDGVVELEKDNPDSRYVVDFKSCKSEKYEFISTRTRKPDAEYITQITIYMWLLGVHKGIIYYENKNDQEILEFHVPYSEDRVNTIKKTAKQLLDFIENKKVPKVSEHYSPSKKPCMYCGYCKLCHKIGVK